MPKRQYPDVPVSEEILNHRLVDRFRALRSEVDTLSFPEPDPRLDTLKRALHDTDALLTRHRDAFERRGQSPEAYGASLREAERVLAQLEADYDRIFPPRRPRRP